MKRALLIAIFGLSCSAVCKPAFKGGHWVGNGGDSMAMAIFSRIRELYSAYKTLTPDCAQTLPLTKSEFAEILAELDISTSPDPLFIIVNGRKIFKEALNYKELVAIEFYRVAYKESQNRDQLILHEVMGLKDKPDPGGEASEYFAAVLNGKGCAVAQNQKPEEPAPAGQSEALGPGEIPLFSEIDRKGVLYFLVSGRNKVFRYSVREKRYLEPLITGENPITLGVSADGDRVYVAYPERRISVFEFSRGIVERPFVTASIAKKDQWDDDFKRFEKCQISKLIVMNGILAVIPNGYDWLNFVFYAKNGTRISQTGWKSPVVAIAPEAGGKGLYQVTGWSPRTLAYLPLQAVGRNHPEEMEWPYHGRLEAAGPLAVSPLYVAMGSGVIVNTSKMESVKQLAEKFDRGTWLGASLYFASSRKSGFSIQAVTAPTFDFTYEKNFDLGSVVSIHTLDKSVVVVWVDAAGNVRIETVH